MNKETTEQKIQRLQKEIIRLTPALLLDEEAQDLTGIRVNFEKEAEEACAFAMQEAEKNGEDREKACNDAVEETKARYMEVEIRYLQQLVDEKNAQNSKS